MHTAKQPLHFARSLWLRTLTGLLSLSLITTLGLTACGGGSDDTSSQGSGQVNISLTDAEGDFVSYTMDVLSLTLTKANGSVVETLPLKTRIDFAQYTDVTEFLTAASVPHGVYVKGSIKLDYANADIQVEDANGDAIKVSSIVDSSGNPVTTLDASVKLEGLNALPVVPGVPMYLSLDFDLKASNTIEFDNTGKAALTVEPFLLAEVDRESDKVLRLRGPLKSVNVNNNSLQLFVHPFHHPMTTGALHFGSVHVNTDDNTIYEIDGLSYQGADGLLSLSELTTLTGVVVRGSMKFKPRRFEAHEVYAGSSIPGGNMDVVQGSVVARSGDVVTLRGATLMRNNGSIVFSDHVTITLAASTTVKKQLSIDDFSLDDISVGQRLTVFGTLSNDQISQLELDASNGYARMQVTTLRGSVVKNDASPSFDVQLSSINGRNPSLYDFSGTGTSAAQNADPAQYEIDSATLDVSGFVVNNKVAVGGFVQPFGQAPKDFAAHTLVSHPSN